MLQESVNDEQCVVAVQLQQWPSVIFNVSNIISANYTTLSPGIVPNLCNEILRKDRGKDQGITNYFQEFLQL